MRELLFFGSGKDVVLLHARPETAEHLIQTGVGLRIAVPTGVDRDAELSPWPAPAVFPKQPPFAGRGREYLEELRDELLPRLGGGRRYIAGYSMAGMFALYAALSLGGFDGVASVSGSLWYPGFIEWLGRNAKDAPPRVYLSVGDRERYTRNPAFARIEDCTREAARLLSQAGSDVALRSEPGTHFTEPEARLRRAIACFEAWD